MTHIVAMPKLSPHMKKGRILQWLKRPGDLVSIGESIALVQSGKNRYECPATGLGRLLEQVAATGAKVEPGKPIAILEKRDAEIKRAHRPFGSEPAPDLIQDGTLADFFELQAARTPRQAALVYGQETYDYRTLDQKSNRLAHHLIKRADLKPGALVAIMMAPCDSMIVAILAVLKAGAGYLPLSPDGPGSRVHYIVRDAGCALLLTERRLLAGAPTVPKTFFPEEIVSGETGPVQAPRLAELPAYVIYTSGSTGEPKGVLITHRSVANNIFGSEAYRPENGAMNVAFTASFTFDASVQQIFGALLNGHCLHVLADDTVRDAALLNEYLKGRRIDVLNCTPTLLYMALQAGLSQALGPAPRYLHRG